MASFEVPWTAKISANTFDQSDLLLTSAPGATDKLEISASVYSLYVYGTWTFVGSSSLIETGRLAVGNIIHFDFFPDDGNVYSYDLAILSLINGPGSDTAYMGESYQLTLISPWYFDQVIKSKAYTGGITNILNQVINEDLPNSFSAVNISNQYDNPLVVRYRTIQTPGRFFETRIEYALRGENNTSSFIYTNLKNQFEVVDYISIKNDQQYTCVSLKSPNLGTYQPQLADATLSTFFLFPHSVMLSLNNGPSKQLWHLANPGLLFLYHVDGTVNTVNDLPVLIPFTRDVANPFTLVSASNPGVLTKIYDNDSFDEYSDIFSSVLNTYTKDLLDSFSLNITGYPNMNIDIGRFMFVDLLNKDTSSTSLFAQSYLIRTVSHIFQGFRGTTHVELTTPALSTSDPNSITNLYQPNSSP